MKYFKQYFLCIVFLALYSPSASSAQNTIVDSLLSSLPSSGSDTAKANAYNLLAMEFRNSDPDTSIYFAKQALGLSIKTDHKIGIAGAYLWMGTAITNLGKYDEALEYLLQATEILNKTIHQNPAQFREEKRLLARANNNIGNIYDNRSNYPEALKYHFSALKLREEIGDKKGISTSYNNIGIIYTNQGNFPEALKTLLACLKIKEEIGDKIGKATVYGNIGNVYNNLGNYNEALRYQFMDLKIAEEIGDKTLMAFAYGNIGNNYLSLGNYQEALKNQMASLKLLEEVGNQRAIANAYNNIGNIFTKKGMYADALSYLYKGKSLAQKLGAKNLIKESYMGLSSLDSVQGNWKEAYKNNILVNIYRDSILNEENIKKTVQAEMNYEFDKKQTLEKAIQEKKDAVAIEEKRKQAVIRNAFIVGFCFVLLLSVVIFRGYHAKKKSNELIILQKKMVEERNKAITDSINYAQRIQQSVMVPEEEIRQYLPEFFIFFQPKDIVSGDFYWFSRVKKKIVVAVVDCTGHGVPGAFMSLVGNILMNEIINDQQITSPAEILRELNRAVRTKLRQEKGDEFSQDGMDMALCTIDKESGTVQYAGAQNPLYVIRGNDLTVIKADAVSIGGKTQKYETSGERLYTNHELKIEKDMSLYLVSDGYPDQFGGHEKKKFGTQRLGKMLTDHSRLDMKEQKALFSKTILEWKGSNKQVDDMLMMGIRV